MSLNIKNAAVRALAERLGVSQVGAVEVAVRDKLAALDAAERRTHRSRRLRDTASAAQAAFRGVDLRSIVATMYDEATGMPR